MKNTQWDEALVFADRADEEGKWEEAAWWRLEAWFRASVRKRYRPAWYPKDPDVCVGHYWVGFWVVGGCRESYRWYRKKTNETTGWRSHGEVIVPPDWLRQSVEEVSLQALELVLDGKPRRADLASLSLRDSGQRIRGGKTKRGERWRLL